MARKKAIAPADLSVEARLEKLYQLQQLLSQIDDIRTLRGELPLEVEDLESEVEGLHTRAENLTAEVREIRARINELKTKVDISTSKLEDYKNQLDRVRNNREYEMLNKEIEFQTLDIELSQKRIREAQAAEQAKEELIETTKHNAAQREEDLEAKKGELDSIIAETREQEEKLVQKAEELQQYIDERLLNSFLRIRKNSRNGLGIVYVNRDACGGCFAKIPPQRQLDVRLRKKVIVCEFCGRILIDPELAGVQTTQPAVEEKPKRRRSASRTTRTSKAAAPTETSAATAVSAEATPSADPTVSEALAAPDIPESPAEASTTNEAEA